MNRLLLVALVGLWSCHTLAPITPGEEEFVERTAREAYIFSLEQAQLTDIPMTQQWMRAGQQVLNDSTIINAPFRESGYFSSSEPEARAYRFDVKEGQVLTAQTRFKSSKNARLFLDLFIWQTDSSKWQHVAYADSTATLTYEFDASDHCLVRLQPELMIEAFYTISLSLSPLLINPVSGASNSSIGSFYGDGRDAGRRKHEGLDIFARRGTPVIAPVDGFVRRTGNNNLGGKVVWLRDDLRRQNYYFAHLDSQIVQRGTYVKKGDTLGLVGNTGNARTTPPHLHFGIYQRGSKDPIDYVRTLQSFSELASIDTVFHAKAYHIVQKEAPLRAGPGTRQPTLKMLQQDDYVRVVGQSQDWYRVALPDGLQGFVYRNQASPLPTRNILQMDSAVLLSRASLDAVPIRMVYSNTEVMAGANFKRFTYVRTDDGYEGWMMMLPGKIPASNIEYFLNQ